jgi:hypothetical protein
MKANSETGKVPFRDVTSNAHLNHVFSRLAARLGISITTAGPISVVRGAADYRSVVPKRLLRNLAGERFRRCLEQRRHCSFKKEVPSRWAT